MPNDNLRSEPEIIPPDRTRQQTPREDSRVWVSIDRGDGRGAQIKQPGPFTVALVVAGVILLLALVVMLVLGALLVWVPIVATIAVVGIVAATLKHYFRRPR